MVAMRSVAVVLIIVPVHMTLIQMWMGYTTVAVRIRAVADVQPPNGYMQN
jgi:hypothetical protein